ncbi:glycosyl transferase family 1 [Sulfitobacter sp. JL08]|uniref:glycosyltransferase family 4 protein n=1 Tax=Sulfitobacter sp. JL08 TaxID=2070369 RepID=UPI000E0B1E07|nr:glycosyltransferase family 4 protein [Sulfitobacter sp. JL08]AXI54096.1 glycosyl transferase family 1 [Sulfitobacter sp. JL08]
MLTKFPNKMPAMRIAILATHPIQYNAPLFRELASRQSVDPRVFYSWKGTETSIDPEFGRTIKWDIPLLEGYPWEMVPNVSRDEGTHHFGGLNNPDMNRRVEEWNPDALLVYGWAWRTHLKAMRYFKGRVPVILRGDSTLMTSNKAWWKRLFRKPALQWVYSNVDFALSPGQQNHAYLRAMGMPENRIRWMPHAIDTQRFSPNIDVYQAGADQIRRDNGIASDAHTYLFAGKLVLRKDVDTLLVAFRKLVAKYPRARLLIAGDGPERQRLQAITADLPQVTFLGFRNQAEMPAVYLAGDTVVLPSRNETWGLAVNEALSLARTVVASDRVGAAPDLLAGKPYARVFACGQASGLENALQEFLVDRSTLVKLGSLAREDSAAWSIPAAADSVLELLWEIADLRCPPARDGYSS